MNPTSARTVRRAIRPGFAALAAALFLALSGLAAHPAAAQQAGAETTPRIEVSGTGEVSVVPDMAWLSVGVSEQAESAEEALDAASVALEAVLARLESAGIAPGDIQTGSLRLAPDYTDASSYASRRVTSYTASSSVEVRVLDLAILGKVMDAVVADGANGLAGLRFDIRDDSEALAEARRAAVADARGKAELFAEAAGVSLTGLVSLVETGGGGYQPMPMMEARSVSSSVPVAEGEITISANIQMVYSVAE